MMVENIDQVALFGAYLHEGAARDHAVFIKALKYWDQVKGGGHLEFIAALTAYAPLLARLAAGSDNHPGVFAYEVVAPFGVWFVLRVADGHIPTAAEAEREARALARDFFGQGCK